MIESVLPGLKRLGFDGIPSVRKALVTCCVKVLNVIFSGGVPAFASTSEMEVDVVDGEAAMRDDEGDAGARGNGSYEPFAPALLSYIMGMMCDDVEEVKEVAVNEMNDLAALYFKVERGGESVFNFAGADAKALISTFYERLLKPLLDDAAHWTEGQREKSLKTLKVLVEYGGGTSEDGKSVVVGDLEILLSCLASSVRDDEELIKEGAEAVAKTLGEKLDGNTAAIDVLLPRVDGSVSGMNTAEKLTGSLVVLASILEGSGGGLVKSEADRIARGEWESKGGGGII